MSIAPSKQTPRLDVSDILEEVLRRIHTVELLLPIADMDGISRPDESLRQKSAAALYELEIHVIPAIRDGVSDAIEKLSGVTK